MVPTTDAQAVCRIRWKASTGRWSPGGEHLDAKPNDLERYNYLIGESDWNERTIANPSLKASLRKSNEGKIEALSKPRRASENPHLQAQLEDGAVRARLRARQHDQLL